MRLGVSTTALESARDTARDAGAGGPGKRVLNVVSEEKGSGVPCRSYLCINNACIN